MDKQDKKSTRGSVTVICNGHKRIFKTRKEAMDLFFEGMFACEGSESERYKRIYMRLASGERNVSDQLL